MINSAAQQLSGDMELGGKDIQGTTKGYIHYV